MEASQLRYRCIRDANLDKRRTIEDKRRPGSEGDRGFVDGNGDDFIGKAERKRLNKPVSLLLQRLIFPDQLQRPSVALPPSL